MKKLLLVCTCLVLTLIINAQTIDKKWNIGLHAGVSQYNGDLGNTFYTSNIKYGLGGISVSRYIGSHFDLNLQVTKGTVAFNKEGGIGNFNSGFTSALLNFRFNILGPASFVRPYLFVGGGAMLFDKDLTITKDKVDYIAPSFGGGVNIKLGQSVMLNLQESFLYSTSDLRDGMVGNANDMYLFHTVGFTFNFGDGIADYLDSCPDQAGSKSLNGCPDRDSDGIADKDDSCPDVAGLAAFKGCPDSDGDGIADKDDRCPDLKGSAELKGCPDSDKDGIADLDDKCPNTIAGYKVDATGCPMDNDKDGIVNEEDACPDKAGNIAMKGCPDTDGDGVADNEDRCPTVKGNIANKGCPEIAVEDVKKITQIASKIFFETNSDVLKVASLAQLDELSEILKRYEAANLIIEGHADSQGEDAYNLALSQKRTESVKTYLMGKGIMESRLTAIGYGESKPIADNNTSLGRAKNRRVELKTSY